MAGLLADVYSFGNRTRNKLRGLLDDPIGTLQQAADATAEGVRNLTGQNEVARQFALRDKINAGDKNALAEYKRLGQVSQNKLFDLATNFNPAAVGMTAKVAKEAPYAEAHRIAQRNAALPVEQGGLGLPANNTAMDRAKAMEVNYPTAHGTRSDVSKIETEKTGSRIGANPSSHLGFFSTPNFPEASRYSTDFGKEGGNVMPLLVRKGKAYEIPNKQFEELSMGEFTANGTTPKERWINASEKVKAFREQLINDGYDSIVRFSGRPMEEVISLKPENIRSRFAAFDPMRRHEADLLGYATVPNMLGAAALGAGGMYGLGLLGGDK